MSDFSRNKELVLQFRAALEQKRSSTQQSGSSAILDYHQSDECVARRDRTHSLHKDSGHTDQQHKDHHTDVHSQYRKPK